jgi:hypothetical protein
VLFRSVSIEHEGTEAYSDETPLSAAATDMVKPHFYHQMSRAEQQSYDAFMHLGDACEDILSRIAEEEKEEDKAAQGHSRPGEPSPSHKRHSVEARVTRTRNAKRFKPRLPSHLVDVKICELEAHLDQRPSGLKDGGRKPVGVER